MAHSFAAPDPTDDFLKLDDNVLGHLLIINPRAFEPDRPYPWGNNDTIVVEVADVDTDRAFAGTTWWQKKLVSALRGRVGELVLGRMSKGTAMPGKTAPWVLERVDDPVSVNAAHAWLARNPDFGKTAATQAAATAPAAPAPQVVPQPLDQYDIPTPAAPVVAPEMAPPAAPHPAGNVVAISPEAQALLASLN